MAQHGVRDRQPAEPVGRFRILPQAALEQTAQRIGVGQLGAASAVKTGVLSLDEVVPGGVAGELLERERVDQRRECAVRCDQAADGLVVACE